MYRKQIAIMALALWLIIVAVVMLFIQRLDFEIFYILGFVGILVIAELMAPRYVQTGSLRYIRYLVLAGTVIFGAIVLQAVLKILG